MSRVPKNVSRPERAQPRKTEDPAPNGPAVPGGDPAAGKRPNRQPPWEKEAGSPESGSFGDWLRRQRELREISLRDIAERTKISLRYLEAMEDDRFDLLPAPVFAKGFLREYARYVGLSPDEVVNHWLSVQPAGEGERPADAPPATGRAFRNDHPRADPAGRGTHASHPAAPPHRAWMARALILLGILIAVVLAVGAVYYTLEHRGGRQPRSRSGAGALPVTAP